MQCNDFTDTEPMECGQIIKLEHAYATATETLSDFDYLYCPQDPLVITAEDVASIKAENVEIKTEPLDEAQTFTEEVLSLREDLTPTDEEHVIKQEVEEVEFVKGPSLSNYVVANPTVEQNQALSPLLALQSAYSELLRKRDVLVSQLERTHQRAEKLSKENKAIKKDFTKFRSKTNSEKQNKKHATKLLDTELRVTKEKESSLQEEIMLLRDENAQLKKERAKFALNGNHEYLENSISKMKNSVEQFMGLEKLTLENLKKLKSELVTKENENKNMKVRLGATIHRMVNLKKKLLAFTTQQKINQRHEKKVDELQKKLLECLKLRYLYEDHADLIKKEMNTKLQEKVLELEKAKEEITCLRQSNMDKVAADKVIRDKFRTLLQGKEEEMRDCKIKISKLQVEMGNIYKKLRARSFSKLELEKEITDLKAQLEKTKNKECDYCGL